MTLTDWSRTILFRATAISLAGLMAFNATANGLEMLGIFAAESGQKIARKFVGHYTDKPTRVYLGEAPGRDPHRDNWWTARQRADYSRAKLNKLFSQAIEDGNVLASTVPAAVASFALLQGGSGGGNSGGGSPGEGEGPGGGSGSTGGGGSPGPGQPGGGMGGESNTNTGNKLSALPVVSWGSLGDSGVSFNLYHSSRTDWNETLGHGWSHSYEAEITYTSGSSAILRMPDGLLVPYTEASGVFTPPPGWNHDLVRNSGGSFTLTFKDQKKMEFNSSGQLTQVKDRNGNATNITRNGSGLITLIESADGRDLTLTYNGSGRVSTITDPLSRVWTLAYNASSQLTGVTYPTLNSTSHTRSFTYNAAHDILTETDLRGKVWTWTYDSEGKMTSFSNPLSQTTSYSYTSTATTITFPDTTTRVDNYSSGLLASRVDEASFSSAFVYDTDRNITRLTDKRGKEWTATYDSKGNVLTRANPLNKTWTYTYSSLNDLLTAENPKGEDTIYTRDGSGRVTLIDDGLGRDSVRYTYDSFGQVLTAKDALNRTTTYSYNSKSELTSTTDPGSVTTTLAYDNLSRVTSITDAALNTTTLTYDAWGRAITVTHPDSSAAAVTYNNEGQVLSSQDEEGRVSSWTYDDAGRQTSFTNGRSDTETYAYNSVDLLASVTNGRGKTRTYTYTSRGEVASLTMPDGTEEDWTYNGEGQETSYTNGLGQVNSYTYDDAGQSTGVDYPSGTDTSFTYDDAGRVTAMVDGTGTTAWVYDAAGQISSLAQPQGTLTYTYNLAGQRTAQSGASQSQSWTFNGSTGRLTSTSNGFGEDTTFTYDSLGRLATKTFEGNNYEVYTYDSRGRLTNIKHRRPNTDILREYTYTYDDSGKVLTYRVGTLTTTYAYDGAGQLTSESRAGYSATYSYDGNGNRLTRTVGGTTENYAYDDGDKLQDVKVGGTAIKTFGYDAAGRTTSVTTSAGTTTIGYDFESRATSISGPGISQSNTYNGLDTRVSSTTNSVSNTFLRDGAYVTDPVVKDSNATYTPGLYERRAGSTRQLHHNLKNVELQTTLTPAVSASRTYDAFGNVLSSTGTHRGPFGYGGGFGYQEDATGLKLLGHRLYDSSTGRFLTRDPIKDGRNWYVYCGNDPVSGVDPTGLWVETAFDVAMLAVGIADFVAEPNIWTGIGVVIDVAAVIFPVPNIAAVRHLDDAVDAGRGIGRGIRGGADACFAAGTPILLADGTTKPIETIEVGDLVYSRGQDADESESLVVSEVTETFVRQTSGTLLLKLEDGQTLETTSEHPFYVKGLGFVPAGELKSGFEIAEQNEEYTTVLGAVHLEPSKLVYNIEVKGTHTYFVKSGDDFLWVHNLCVPPGPGLYVGTGKGGKPYVGQSGDFPGRVHTGHKTLDTTKDVQFMPLPGTTQREREIAETQYLLDNFGNLDLVDNVRWPVDPKYWGEYGIIDRRR